MSNEIELKEKIINNNNDIISLDLLNFYRDQVNQFEDERQNIMKRFGDIDVAYETLHKLKWELHVKEEEVSELQDSLSNANCYLFDEREQVLKLQAENDQLKMEQMEDRRRIQHLLALTQPVKQEVTFFKDCRPGKITEMPVTINKNDKKKSGPSYNRILRTIYMPSERTDELILRIESLQNQLEETQKVNEERIVSIVEDKKVREEELKQQINRLLEKEMANEEDLRKVQKILQKTTKDLLEERIEFQKKERKYNEQILLLTQEKEGIETELNEKDRVYNVQIECIKERLERESELLTSHIKDELISKDEDINVIKLQYEKSQQLANKKLNEYENEIRKWKKKYIQLNKQRNLEFEGYNTDLQYLQSQCDMITEACAKKGIYIPSKYNGKMKNTKSKNIETNKKKIESRINKLKTKIINNNKENESYTTNTISK